MKTKIFVALSLLFFTCKADAQNYKFIYYLDKNLNSVDQSNAAIIGKGYQKNDIFILNCFLKSSGIMIASATVKDSSLSTLHGLFTTYYDDMKTESEGNYFENKMDGLWKYWNEHGLITDSVFYNRGIKTAFGTYEYNFKKPTLSQLVFSPGLKDTLSSYSYSFTDSLKNTFTEKEISVKNGNERLNSELNFIGERGLLKNYDSTGTLKTDSVFTRKIEDAKFVGGVDAWLNFLRKNINSLVPAQNNAPEGTYIIILKFIVKPDGALDDIKPENDPGYGMATEGIRVLRKSPKWIPASKYGIYQRADIRQPISFRVEIEKGKN